MKINKYCTQKWWSNSSKTTPVKQIVSRNFPISYWNLSTYFLQFWRFSQISRGSGSSAASYHQQVFSCCTVRKACLKFKISVSYTGCHIPQHKAVGAPDLTMTYIRGWMQMVYRHMIYSPETEKQVWPWDQGTWCPDNINNIYTHGQWTFASTLRNIK